jgi:predicted short-subunit dehydrogenase-like oxidoreductase (DUF2520 family)
VKHSDIIFITTTDDQIENIVVQLSQGSWLKPEQLVIHTSGALSSTSLEPLKIFGCGIFSMHPLQSFAKVEKAVSDLNNSFFCIEGDELRLKQLEEILNICGNKYFKLKADEKTLYHASACMISNYFVTLVHNSLQLMESIKIPSSLAFNAMLPLIQGTLQNIVELGTEHALTGPIVRGDSKTLEKQLEAVEAFSPEQLTLYSVMAEKTIDLAATAKLEDKEKIDQLRDVLKPYIE